MKIPLWLRSLPFLAALCLLCSPCRASSEVNFSFFYDSLEPYGEWINTPEYGYCWRPTEVDPDWSPYVDGYWSYTDAGWTWVSYEDWGGICYHYGRWTDLEGEGWCWVPDYEWGPAWVSWRNNPEYIGWAPLPPEARFRRDVGFSVWTDTTYDIGPGAYRFCAVEDFGAPVVREVLVPRHRNVIIVRNTYNITNICYHTSSVFCGGPDFTFISTRCRRPIPALKIVQNVNINIYFDRTERRRLDCLNAVPRGNTLQVFAPVVAPPKKIEVLKPSHIAKVLPAAKPTGGWGILPDLKQKQDLRATLAKQTEGLTPIKAPAVPVKPAQLQPVPVKADPTLPTLTRPTLPPSERRPAIPLPKSSDQARPGSTAGVPQEKTVPGVPAQKVLPKSAPVTTTGATPSPSREATGTPATPGLPQVLPREPVARPVAEPQEKNAISGGKPTTPKPSFLKPLPAITAPGETRKAAEPGPESLRKQQEDAMRSQTLKQQQETARTESLRRQQEDAMRSQALKQQQQQETARTESLRRQQEDAMRSQALKQQQQQETARTESLRRQQEDAMRSQALKQRQQQETARTESLRRQQEDAMRSQALRQQQQQEAARTESLRRQQESAMRSQALKQQQEAARSQALRPVPQSQPRPVPVQPVPTPSSGNGKKKEKE